MFDPFLSFLPPPPWHLLRPPLSARTAEFLAARVVPRLRERNGDAANAVAGLVAWLDGQMLLPRGAMRVAVTAATESPVRNLTATYRRTGPASAQLVQEAVIAVAGGPGLRLRCTEEDVPLDEVPDEVRARFMEAPDAPVTVDLAAEIRTAVEEKLKREADRPARN